MSSGRLVEREAGSKAGVEDEAGGSRRARPSRAALVAMVALGTVGVSGGPDQTPLGAVATAAPPRESALAAATDRRPARDMLAGEGGAARRLHALPQRAPVTAKPPPRTHLDTLAVNADPWSSVAQILKRVSPPTFPARTCDVTSFGAVADGRTDARQAFADAIAACHGAGGGKVLVPAGQFLLRGPIHFKSNINLHLVKDAVIRFSNDPAHYLPPVLVRWEGTRCFNYSPLIYAYRQKNVAITGAGRIDGQATSEGSGWMKILQVPAAPGKRREDLRSMGRALVPVEKRIFGAGSNLRPQLLHTYETHNILIEGVTFTGSPFWTLNPTLSSNITVRGVKVLGHSRHTLTNDDGFIADSCQNVLVENSTFDNTCDNVSVKAGRDNDSWGDQPSENIVIRNSEMLRGWGGIVVGSEVGGGVRNVFVENNILRHARFGIHVKSNSFRGGVIDGFYTRNNTVGHTEECIRIESGYGDVSRPPHATPFRHFQFENFRCGMASVVGIRSEGLAILPISHLLFRDVVIGRAPAAVAISNTRDYTLENVRINGVQLAPEASERSIDSAFGARAAR